MYGKNISHVIEMGVGGQVQWSLLRFDFLVFFLWHSMVLSFLVCQSFMDGL